MKNYYTYHIDGLADWGPFYTLKEARAWVAYILRCDIMPANKLRGLWGMRRGDIIRTSETGRTAVFASRKGGKIYSK